MKTTFATVAGVAALALSLSTSDSDAGYYVPGETMGSSFESPLPEGIFFCDLETYGRSDRQPDTNIGVNIPLFLWSTPWTFYNTRLEFVVAFPFVHTDTNVGAAQFGPFAGAVNTALNKVGAATYALGPIFAHDFGGGLSGGIMTLVRTPDPSTNIRNIFAQTTTEGDFRESLQYIVQSGPMAGFILMENGGVSTALGQSGYAGLQPTAPILTGLVRAQNDMFAGDFTIEKIFGKLTVGFTGFGNTDIDDRSGAPRQSSVELGGLLGYDFGRFNVTAIVTRTVYTTGIGDTLAGTISGDGFETRGWLKVAVPLYIAPPPPSPVVARY